MGPWADLSLPTSGRVVGPVPMQRRARSLGGELAEAGVEAGAEAESSRTPGLGSGRADAGEAAIEHVAARARLGRGHEQGRR